MSTTSADELQYIEQFIPEYRAGYKVFVKATSQGDKDVISATLFSMERYEMEKSFHREALATAPLTIEEASQYAKKNWLGRKDFHEINKLVMRDVMERSGTNEDIAAHAFKLYLDKARSLGLIRDSEIARKFNECTEKNTDLEAIINRLRIDLKKCQDDFEAYKKRLQPLGTGKTETGGTSEDNNQAPIS